MLDIPTIAELQREAAPLPPGVIDRPVQSATVAPAVVSREYKLFYPDNSKDSYYNGTYIIDVGGINHKMEIVNGVITTDCEEYAELLVDRGFQLISSVEISSEVQK